MDNKTVKTLHAVLSQCQPQLVPGGYGPASPSSGGSENQGRSRGKSMDQFESSSGRHFGGRRGWAQEVSVRSGGY